MSRHRRGIAGRHLSFLGGMESPAVSRHCWGMEFCVFRVFNCFLEELSPQQCPGTAGQWNSVDSVNSVAFGRN